MKKYTLSMSNKNGSDIFAHGLDYDTKCALENILADAGWELDGVYSEEPVQTRTIPEYPPEVVE